MPGVILLVHGVGEGQAWTLKSSSQVCALELSTWLTPFHLSPPSSQCSRQLLPLSFPKAVCLGAGERQGGEGGEGAEQSQGLGGWGTTLSFSRLSYLVEGCLWPQG